MLDAICLDWNRRYAAAVVIVVVLSLRTLSWGCGFRKAMEQQSGIDVLAGPSGGTERNPRAVRGVIGRFVGCTGWVVNKGSGRYELGMSIVDSDGLIIRDRKKPWQFSWFRMIYCCRCYVRFVIVGGGGELQLYKCALDM